MATGETGFDDVAFMAEDSARATKCHEFLKELDESRLAGQGA